MVYQLGEWFGVEGVVYQLGVWFWVEGVVYACGVWFGVVGVVYACGVWFWVEGVVWDQMGPQRLLSEQFEGVWLLVLCWWEGRQEVLHTSF